MVRGLPPSGRRAPPPARHRVQWLWEDQAVASWRSRFNDRSSKWYTFQEWFLWLVKREGFNDATPSKLLELVEGDLRAARKIAQLVDEFAIGKGGTWDGILTKRSHVRSFFRNHNLELPKTFFHATPTKEPQKPKLTVATIKEIIGASSLRDKAVYLSIWTGFMDIARFVEFNAKYGYELGEYIKNKGAGEPFKADFVKGRKMNRSSFYSFVGTDALTAWKDYFERQRGYPKPSEAAALTTWNTPISDQTIKADYLKLLRSRLGLIPKDRGDRSSRYGYNLHEWRDAAKTYVRTMPKKAGFNIQGKMLDFDPIAIEFFMGHSVDPFHYDKFYEDVDYTSRQYKIAALRLNIISSNGEPREEYETKLKDEYEARYQTQVKQLYNMVDQLSEKLAQVEKRLQ